ncbi:uncharacterized protein P174DRAFT_173006 [Aspergillus novofumigatus IBT 16806]|uniref:Uncharacterized protein n=1 Tax=Aspergillus novofumigatus (strain IBT 16806) TaxID=1392255 RepID=A0A2I1C935_ASPN1|nr:uncharacterized protein P174DRAFT_173006 [Aspergillus novofumigatus IBT 16806]PKX94133.1 hypothetical protein P174DRAFT_173006 [Aspergillus novofumigatus IBT 16806]
MEVVLDTSDHRSQIQNSIDCLMFLSLSFVFFLSLFFQNSGIAGNKCRLTCLPTIRIPSSVLGPGLSLGNLAFRGLDGVCDSHNRNFFI